MTKKLKTPAEIQAAIDVIKEEPPIEFFATIHHRNYKPGEVEEINRNLQAKLENKLQNKK